MEKVELLKGMQGTALNVIVEREVIKQVLFISKIRISD